MQKEAEEAVQRCQDAEEKAKKAATEVHSLTDCSFLTSRVDQDSSQGAEADLQPKRILLILHTARRRLADPSVSLCFHFEKLGQLAPPFQTAQTIKRSS